MNRTLQQVADETGKPYAVVKKHAQRGRLKTTKDGRNIVVTEEDLAIYKALEGLRVATDVMTEQPKEGIREIGHAIGQLPQEIRDAILDGIPHMGKPKREGSSKHFLEAVAGRPTNHVELPTDDPHFGYPPGYRHSTSPRWSRSRRDPNTWTIGEASWTWNGIFWESGGSIAGRSLSDGEISPGHPDATMRPLAPGVPVPVK